ncbi:MAG: SDR family NAD(P)-dependent oxidoreductase, partial [Bradyrhizobium sp.]|nr:SDR family NAD(P)-dependent oxidoreductase [Bradyrhizobium sp.]
MSHAALAPNSVAVITGGASGIGLAAAGRFAALGMNVCIADVDDARLHAAAAKLAPLAKRGEAIMTAKVDVSRRDSVVDLEAK